MLRRIEEYREYVEITGFRNISIDDAKNFLSSISNKATNDLEMQLYNADLVATWEHLYFAALNALMAFKTNRNISKTLAVETALYASAQRQIKKALDLIGIKPCSKNVAIMIISANKDSIQFALSAVSKALNAEEDESVLNLSETKNRIIKNTFNITETELEASSSDSLEQKLLNLIIERGALLSTRI